jgi:multicomponent Na+:H+ antiporter subunit E
MSRPIPRASGPHGSGALPRRIVRLAVWAFAIWLLMTWTVTAEQLLFGAGLAIAVAVTLAPLADVARPWRLLHPRVLGALGLLVTGSLARIVRANVELAGRIWAPSRPLRSGMVIVPSGCERPAMIGATGLITSLIVDNQIVDLDTDRRELQYHAVAVPPGDPQEKAEHVNRPTERALARLTGD